MEYAITFSDSCSPKLREKIINCLNTSGLLCEPGHEGKETAYVGAKFDTLVNKVSCQ